MEFVSISDVFHVFPSVPLIPRLMLRPVQVNHWRHRPRKDGAGAATGHLRHRSRKFCPDQKLEEDIVWLVVWNLNFIFRFIGKKNPN
jgi:hypothetical protein